MSNHASIRKFDLDGGPRSFRFGGERSVGLRMRGEQGFEALADGGIACAHRVEEGGRASAGFSNANPNSISSRLAFIWRFGSFVP